MTTTEQTNHYISYQLDQIPFTLAGSFLTIAARNASGSPRLLYRTASGKAVTRQGMPFNAPDFFELALLKDGQEIPYQWTAQPHRLDLITDGNARVTFAFADADTLLFETHHCLLRLLPAKNFAQKFSPRPDQVYLIDHPARGFHILRAGKGTQLEVVDSATVTGYDPRHGDLPRTITFTGGEHTAGALRFSSIETDWTDPLPELEETVSLREIEFGRWLKLRPEAPSVYEDTANQAWFLMWNSTTPASGPLTRPAIYMSKFWMNGIWAWDNCFTAMAVAKADPELAWNQMLMFFDNQDANGMIPDQITDLECWNCFTKPPIYGWAIRKMISKLGPVKSKPYLDQLYKPLARLTEWWYTYRDYDGDGMCQYHHGNDSGWDNATLFDQGYPTEGADLAAHLTLQCEMLAEIAFTLGKVKASKRWRERAEKQLDNLLEQGVKDNRFFSPLDGHRDAPPSQSLVNYIPMVLGHRLPKKIRAALLQDLGTEGPFLTPYGYASEAPASPKYTPDGYWRGPVWAASTYMIFDGLVDAKEFALARTVAERFCDLCVKEPGFWENYDALTGKGLRCPGYTWTASVFLLMAEWLAAQERLINR
ncbi:MAG: hypothetical protein JW987_09170 [Anaerolineaceae bacterium]|nr:hypothetical protein [Anaerolineaceae bacterium]